MGEAALLEGLSVGAWVGQLAVRSARGQPDAVPVTWQELVAELVRFRTDVSRAALLVNGISPTASQSAHPDPDAVDPVSLIGELLRRVDVATAMAVAAGRPGRGANARTVGAAR